MPYILHRANLSGPEGKTLVDTVFVVCEYVPEEHPGKEPAELAAEVEQTICIPKCGIKRDVKSSTKPIALRCISPRSPYLPVLKKEFGLE